MGRAEGDAVKLNYQRDVIRGVRDHWIRQYANYPQTHQFTPTGPTVAEIWANLTALDLETCSEADIDRAIGVTGWASHKCDECDETKEILAHFGAEPDYDATWQDLCADCLRNGLELLEKP
jgi:hypothetical protein